MTDEGDRLLNIIGAALVVALVVVVAVGIVIAVNVPANRVSPPEGDWTFRQINATHVQVTYESGEPITASSLVVSVDGYTRHPSWNGRVGEGDATAVQAARGQLVRVYWDGGRSDRVRLARWQGGTTWPTTG